VAGQQQFTGYWRVSLDQAELLAQYTTHVFRRTQPTTNWMANEYRAVVAVLGMWKQVGLKCLC
jgi:hypothetical protein